MGTDDLLLLLASYCYSTRTTTLASSYSVASRSRVAIESKPVSNGTPVASVHFIAANVPKTCPDYVIFSGTHTLDCKLKEDPLGLYNKARTKPMS